MNINRRKAVLFTDYHKKTKRFDVYVLLIGVVADENGSNICASVECENGDIIEVVHDCLSFVNA